MNTIQGCSPEGGEPETEQPNSRPIKDISETQSNYRTMTASLLKKVAPNLLNKF